MIHSTADEPLAVLLVMDQPELVSAYTKCLEQFDHSVSICSDGELVVQYSLAHCPDVILLDLAMPQVPTYDLFHILSQTPDTAHIAIVALSPVAHAAEGARLKDLGVSGYHVNAITAVPSVIQAIPIHVVKRRRAAKQAASR